MGEARLLIHLTLRLQGYRLAVHPSTKCHNSNWVVLAYSDRLFQVPSGLGVGIDSAFRVIHVPCWLPFFLPTYLKIVLIELCSALPFNHAVCLLPVLINI